MLKIHIHTRASAHDKARTRDCDCKTADAESRAKLLEEKRQWERKLKNEKDSGKRDDIADEIHRIEKLLDSTEDAVTRGGMPIKKHGKGARDDLPREPLRQQLREKPAPRYTGDAYHPQEHGGKTTESIIDVPGWGKCRATYRPTAKPGDQYKVTHSRTGNSYFGATVEQAAAKLAAHPPPKGAIVPNVIQTGKARDGKSVYRSHGFVLEDNGDKWTIVRPASYPGPGGETRKNYSKLEYDQRDLELIIEEIWQQR